MWGWRTSTRLFEGEAREMAASLEGQLSTVSEPPPLRGALPRVAAEFARARRYERPITIAVFSVAPSGLLLPAGRGAAGTGDGGEAGPFTTALGMVARGAVREIDLVSCDATSGWCIVLMPEIGREEGQRAVARMRQLCTDRLQRPVLAGLAVYPQDGWTFLDLVDAAKRVSSSQWTPSVNVG